MRIVDVMQKALIVPALRATRKAEAIEELAGHITAVVDGLDRDAIVHALMEREQRGSTALVEGLAIPHAKLPNLPGLVACLGRSARGVDFESPDGRRSHFLFVVLAPAESVGSHLKLLARFSQAFRNPDFRRRLMRARTAGDMYLLLDKEDNR